MRTATSRADAVRRPSGAVAPFGAALLMGIVVGCAPGPNIVTTLVFDGQNRTITTNRVSCTNQADGRLLILVDGGRTQSVRIVVDRRGQLVVERAGLRYQDIAGFVADPQEVVATKVDDTYNFSGRMPPKAGEVQWHEFEIETTCPSYHDQAPPRQPGVNTS
jgi:Mycobacterium 19 kDa lipoprotein antigen